MNTTPSWNDIYAAGTAETPKSDMLSSVAFRNLLKGSAAPIGSSVPKIPLAGNTAAKEEENGFEKFVNTPIIKQAIDVLSVGAYSTANFANDTLDGIEKVSKGDLGGILDIAVAPATGVGKGLSAAAGNDNDAVLWHDIIKRGQDIAGVDSENDAAKWVQGIGGFVGDVALDPTTYLSLGGTALVKGGVKGFVEGGKRAAKEATSGAKRASEAGTELSGQAAKIAENADKAGILNRFKNAGVEAKGEYKDWMKANGGKIATWGIPFKNSKNPKDAEAIASTSLARGNREGLDDLVPDTAVPALTASTKLAEEAPSIKPPEVVAEEAAIVNGFKEAAKPAGAPIVDDAVKAVESTPTAAKVIEDTIHENMSEIMKTVKFSRQTYPADMLKAYEDAHKASFPKTLEREIETPAAAPAAPGKVKVAEMMARIQRAASDEVDGDDIKIGTIKFGGKQVHPRVIAKAWEVAPTKARQLSILQKIDPAFVNSFRETVEVAPPSVEKVIEEIPGTPLDFSQFPNLKPEHQGLSPEELIAHRSTTANIRDMTRYINNDASPQELVLMAEKLGLSKSAPTEEIRKAFIANYKTWKERSLAELKAASAAAKVKPEKGRDIAGSPNQETAHILEKIPAEQTLIRRATRAINSAQAMGLPLSEKKLKQELLNHGDIAKLPENAMNRALEVQSGKGRPYKMDGGANSSTPNPTTGTSIYPDKWGTQSAVAIHASLVKGISDIAQQYLKKSGERMSAFTKMELYKRSAVATMANLRAMGIAPYMDLGRAYDSKLGVNLGLDDLTELMFKDMETRFFAGPQKAMQPQAFATGVETLIRSKAEGKTPEQIKTDIMHAFLGDRKIYRGKYKDADGIIKGIDKDSIINAIKGVDAEGKPRAYGMEMAVAAIAKAHELKLDDAREVYINDIAKMAEKWANDDVLYQNLNNRMLVNAKEHAAELGAKVDHVSEETLAKIMEAGTKGISTGDFLKEMKDIEKAGKAALGEADDTKYLLWENALEQMRKKLMKPSERKVIKVAETVAKTAEEVPTPKVVEEVAVANAKAAESAIKEAEEIIEEAKALDPDIPEGLLDVHGGAISIDTMRRIHPISSFFNTKFGLDASGMHGAMGTGLHTQVRMQSIFHGGVMNYLAKNPAKLMDDWKTIQNEGLSHIKDAKNIQSFTPSSDSAKELYNTINMIFDVSKDNIITRNGLGAKHWNAAAEAKGLKLQMDPEKTMLENSRAWLQTEMGTSEEILEFLSKAHAVSTNLASDIAIASNFARNFGSAVPKEGYARLNWTRRGINKNKTVAAGEKGYGFFDLLPKSVYYDIEASRDIANIHRVLNEARAIKSEGAIGSFVNNVFNPITNILKASQTIVRPGHWVNNMLGDIMRNYLAGVNSLVPYRHAIAMMKANGKEMKVFGENPLEAYQWHKATTTGNYEVHGRGDGFVIHIGGKAQKMSYQSFYRLSQDGAVMPKHHGAGVAEDFLTPAEVGGLNRFGNALDKAQTKVLDNDKFSVNALATARDNFGRLSLAIDFAMKGKFKDIHELKAAMEAHVSKWVPTSTDFTAREAKYLRPAFMYYTWIRGVTPRIVDTLMNKPGVALAPSKALYNVAVANGIDPVSMGDPFPPDAQMPSYYYDKVIGPLMHGEGHSMWGINIANPVTDVMNQLGAGQKLGGMTDGSNATSMGKTLLGAASPFAKIPIDMATGQSNGVPITDMNQYLQDALTGSYGGLISKSTGTLWNGDGRTDSSNGSAHGVDQSEIAALQIANFLSGLKITDYQSPSAMRSFVGEQKQKYSELKADYRRNE